ncbi:transcription factor grauzone [Culex quinquefasciatus]|uniref:Transcription factor grauzone n=1 Tax=Culex quinquefasciatus TaxID=7176 RepID=B0XAW1_CULQU|nr:transcription factor grauzone [Culex quinquefasciatus]|eukprot:XP_001866783.1 transcription factor grauzone [Culex quinquefasciatus]
MNDPAKPPACCALCGLTRTQAVQRGLCMHQFPTSPSLRRDWEAFCGGRPGKLLCSGHFTSDCYYGDFPSGKTRKRRPLARGSVPTIRNPWGQPELEEVEAVAPVTGKRVRPSCFLCRQRTKHHVPLVGGVQPSPSEPMSSEEWESYRGTVIAKYFAFEVASMIGEVVCLQCWLKVEEFHRFHGEIEAAHTETVPFAHVQVKQEVAGELDDGVVKQEQLESVIEVKAEQIVDYEAGDCFKREPEPETSFADNFDDSSDHESEENVVEESNQEPPPKKKKRTINALHKSDQLIAQNCVIICDQCSQTFDKFYQLQIHCREVHQTKGRITCCNKDFIERARLLEHLRSHDDPDLLRCVVCQALLSCAGNLRRHQVQNHTVFTGTPVNAMTCEKCAKTFTDKSAYSTHVKGHLALETKQFQCVECDRISAQLAAQKHVIKRHTLKFDYVCEVCAKGFISRQELEAHTASAHDPDAAQASRVQCPDCHRSFSKWSLRKHRLMMHETSEPVSCEICGKQAPNRVALGSHKRFVHRAGKFGCTVCEKTFAKAISLREHMSTHNGGDGEGLYTCPHCPRTFNSNANMHSHRKKVHFEEWLQGRMQRRN